MGLPQFKTLSDKIITLDKEEATKYVEFSPGPVNLVNEFHVQELLDEMLDGTFEGTNVIIASAVLDEEEYQINGRHVCWAVLLHPEDDFAIEGVRRIRYQVSSRSRLGQLYFAFDALYKKLQTS